MTCWRSPRGSVDNITLLPHLDEVQRLATTTKEDVASCDAPRSQARQRKETTFFSGRPGALGVCGLAVGLGVSPPILHIPPGLVKTLPSVHVQALIAKPPIERLDEGVVDRAPGPDGVELGDELLESRVLPLEVLRPRELVLGQRPYFCRQRQNVAWATSHCRASAPPPPPPLGGRATDSAPP